MCIIWIILTNICVKISVAPPMHVHKLIKRPFAFVWEKVPSCSHYKFLSISHGRVYKLQLHRIVSSGFSDHFFIFKWVYKRLRMGKCYFQSIFFLFSKQKSGRNQIILKFIFLKPLIANEGGNFVILIFFCSENKK